MKKSAAVMLSLIILLCISAIFSMKGDGFAFYGEAIPGSTPNVGLTFAVLGDIHDNQGKFEAAALDLYRLNRHMDALVLNGDVVDQGLKSQYEGMKRAIRKNQRILPDIVIKNIGNHEYYDYDRGNNNPAEVEECINSYLDFSGEKNVYHDIWIKGYHFISLGSEEDSTERAGAVKAYIFEKQLQWLKMKLAEKYEPGKPIFVFLHQHITSNTRGWVGVEQREEVTKILEQYPEVIMFTSHTHASLERDNIVQQKPFTVVHTGAVANIYKFNGSGGAERADESQGIYIEVYGDKVVINGRDFKNRKWMFSKDINFQ